MRYFLAIFLLCSSFNLYSFNAYASKGLKPLPRFDWQKVMHAPVEKDNNLVLHFGGSHKPYEKDPIANDFVSKYVKPVGAKELDTDADVLRYGSDSVILDGFYLEMGTGRAYTTNFIAGLNPKKKIYSFDSFEGLTEKWDRPDTELDAGIFAYKDMKFIPPTLKNVVLYKGLFADTLPLFKRKILKNTPIAFLHIDCDLYSGTKDIFNNIGSNIVPGTIIVFDELYNYPNAENHEWRAFLEFCGKYKHNFKVIAFNKNHEQVAVRIIPL